MEGISGSPPGPGKRYGRRSTGGRAAARYRCFFFVNQHFLLGKENKYQREGMKIPQAPLRAPWSLPLALQVLASARQHSAVTARDIVE